MPEIVVIERDGTGPIGRAVVQQADVHNELPVRAVQTESERIWDEIAVKIHCVALLPSPLKVIGANIYARSNIPIEIKLLLPKN